MHHLTVNIWIHTGEFDSIILDIWQHENDERSTHTVIEKAAAIGKSNLVDLPKKNKLWCLDCVAIVWKFDFIENIFRIDI